MSLTHCLAIDICEFLDTRDELFFNERDLQMHLALWLSHSGKYDEVEIEYFIPNKVAREAGYEWESDIKLDLVVRRNNQFSVIELKYPTRKIVAPIKRFNSLISNVEIVKNHGAQDLVSYNFWKDVRRIEVINRIFPKTVTGGIAMILTNDPYYIKGPGSGCIFEDFSTAQQRRNVHGLLDWTRYTKTTQGHPGFTLDGVYNVDWHHTVIGGEKFQYSLIEI